MRRRSANIPWPAVLARGTFYRMVQPHAPLASQIPSGLASKALATWTIGYGREGVRTGMTVLRLAGGMDNFRHHLTTSDERATPYDEAQHRRHQKHIAETKTKNKRRKPPVLQRNDQRCQTKNTHMNNRAKEPPTQNRDETHLPIPTGNGEPWCSLDRAVHRRPAGTGKRAFGSHSGNESARQIVRGRPMRVPSDV